jgi:hypothetical protein
LAKKSKAKVAKPRKRKPDQRSRKSKKPKRRKLVRPKRYDARLEDGLRTLRETKSLAKASRKIGVPPGVLRRYALGTGTIERRNGRWLLKRDRRFRRMLVYSNGQRELVTVHNGKTASLIGSYMGAVRQFLETENIALLKSYQDQSFPDIQGKRHFFITSPNLLLRLDASGFEANDLPYEILKQP